MFTITSYTLKFMPFITYYYIHIYIYIYIYIYIIAVKL